MAEYETGSDGKSDNPLVRELTLQLISLAASAAFENVSVPVHLASGSVVVAELFAQNDAAQRLNIVAHIHMPT
ncbi:MAG: hypothetical protein IPP40_07505 [bacterium]|nr:hypothetical protein [bacterium]